MPAAAGRQLVNATSVCSGATPAAEGVLRKRPLGIVNEGASTVFVNCSLPSDDHANTGYTHVQVTFVSHVGFGGDLVRCTFVSGAAAEAADTRGEPDLLPHYYTSQIEVPPFPEATSLGWTASQEGVDSFGVLASFSCALQPGMEINLLSATYPEL